MHPPVFARAPDLPRFEWGFSSKDAEVAGRYWLCALGALLVHLSVMAVTQRFDVPLPPPDPIERPEPLLEPPVELSESPIDIEELEEQERVAFLEPPPPIPPPPLSEPTPPELGGEDERALVDSLPEFAPAVAPEPEPAPFEDSSVRIARVFEARSDRVATLDMVTARDSGVSNSLTSALSNEVPTALLEGRGGVGLSRTGKGPPGTALGSPGTGAGRPLVPTDFLTEVASGPNLGELERAYILKIGRAIGRVRDYPTSAEDDGLEGTVLLSITIGSGGEIEGVSVVRSSGHAVLDEAAVRSVQKLGSLPEPPSELEWKSKPVRVSIVYRLAD